MPDHPAVSSIDAVAAELLSEARVHGSRRAARTLVSGTSQRATLIALGDGAELAEHDSPPAATLQVVDGTVRLHTQDAEWTLERGQLAVVPPERHGLQALGDAVVLLTVALR
ncbi:cupin domain-containing protein [Amycolatopsis sp. FU40]|uniref:cupin domain-containing protein n=1 Tax=Amycolatopsis sp. FU40 TaxID=2914159 RepID=UPI001F286FB8|nr:cupin domain-containing protein [Amycolatopsis sp. FU40]UKD57381.1 cupin domain-containing protein [Amycolatopsis sp. FU40]